MTGSTDVRSGVLAEIARYLGTRQPGHPLRVGIDGVCGAGKSTFARELCEHVGRDAVRIDSDGFHHPREHRYRRGRTSARGYYEDAYDFDSLADLVLQPLGPGGSGEYAIRVYDLATDAVVTDETAIASPSTVAIFDATFLQRGTLRDLWDEVIYLDSDERAANSRGVRRDQAALGGPEAARAAYEQRYSAACRIYLAEENPKGRASIVVEHTDPSAPAITRIAPPA